MKKRFAGGLALIVAALLLAACNIRVTTDITESGSGQYGFEMGFTKEDQDALTELGSAPEQFCQDMQSEGDLPAGASVVTEQRGDEVYCVMEQPFTSLDELRSLYTEGTGITVNSLDISGGALTYDIDVVMETTDTGGAGVVDMEWEVTVPGTVGNNNADSVEGNTLRWRLTPGETRNIHVESTTGGLGGLLGGDNLIYLISAICGCLFCVVLLAGAGGGIYWFTQRNKQKAAAQP